MTNDNPSHMLAAIHEERIQRVEDRLSDLDASHRSHVETDEIHFNMLGQKMDDWATKVVDRLDILSADIKQMSGTMADHHESIGNLKAKEIARKKVWQRIAKLWWIIPTTFAGGLAHKLMDLFWK
jgi:hypothetical protein